MIPAWLIVHHTGGTDTNPKADSSGFTFDQCDALHKKLFNYKSSLGYYIGYHYYIDRSGTVRQGRADTDNGAHTIGMNATSIGVCLAGNFDVTLPTASQTDALTRLLRRLSIKYGIAPEKVVPHRKFSNKTCYGSKLGDTWAQSLLTGDTTPTCTLGQFTTKELTTELVRRIRGT